MANFTVLRNKLRKMMNGSSIKIWDKRSAEHRIAPGSAGNNTLLTHNA